VGSRILRLETVGATRVATEPSKCSFFSNLHSPHSVTHNPQSCVAECRCNLRRPPRSTAFMIINHAEGHELIQDRCSEGAFSAAKQAVPEGTHHHSNLGLTLAGQRQRRLHAPEAVPWPYTQPSCEYQLYLGSLTVCWL